MGLSTSDALRGIPGPSIVYRGFIASWSCEQLCADQLFFKVRDVCAFSDSSLKLAGFLRPEKLSRLSCSCCGEVEQTLIWKLFFFKNNLWRFFSRTRSVSHADPSPTQATLVALLQNFGKSDSFG